MGTHRGVDRRTEGVGVSLAQTPKTSPPATAVSQADAFEVLSARRRRHVLRYLFHNEEPAELYDLTRQLAAWENDTTPEQVTSTQRMRVYTALKQSHLPKMDDHGVIEFDDDRGTVTLTSDASQLSVYLDVVPHDDIPWSRYYLGLGVFGIGVWTLVGLGVFPFSVVPEAVVGTVLLASFVASALVHTTHTRRLKVDTEEPTQ
jgi:hypothetical protein